MPVARTLAAPLMRDGVGIHTGTSARVELRPAPPGHGRVFRRSGMAIPALADYVTDVRRCVTLGKDGTTVSTVEHLLAALMLAGIDDVDIYIDGPEVPALDGAAKQWFDAIQEAGVCQQDGEIFTITIRRARWIKDGDSQFFLFPADKLLVYAAISIPETVVTDAIAGGPVHQEDIREQILRARTYGLESEVAALLESGLARGGSLENAVVLTRDGYLNARVWPDEPVWHKVLDLVGDLALCGARVNGHILGVRAGHWSHLTLVRALREDR